MNMCWSAAVIAGFSRPY